MNLTKKLALPTLALSFVSHIAYSDCSNPVLSNPTYDPISNTINLPLVKVLNDPNEQLDFVNAKLQLVPGTGLFGFSLSEYAIVGDNCTYVNPIVTYDFSQGKLELPILQHKYFG